MELNLIPFGFRTAVEQFVDVADVPRGRACDCICPSCKTPLIARQGDVKEWHFAHASRGTYAQTKEECKYSFFLSVRLMARQMIGHALSLKLPALTAEVDTPYWKYGYTDRQLSRVVTREQDVILLNCEVEKTLHGMSVDILGEVKAVPLGVYFIHPGRGEPTVTSSGNDDKYGLIGVSLMSLPQRFSEAKKDKKTYKNALIEFLETDIHSKKWLYHPRYNRVMADIEEELLVREKQWRSEQESTVKIDDRIMPQIKVGTTTQPVSGNLVLYECVICKVSWKAYEDSGSVCPQCLSHLYRREIGAENT